MVNLVIKSNIRKKVKELSEGEMKNVANEVEGAIEKTMEEILKKGIERAKSNQRRTLLARDL